MSTQQPLLTLATQVGEKLRAENSYLVTAESCTGGGLGAAITAVSGSSAWYYGGFITYSNVAKINLLNVDPALIETFGAVSEPVAKAMAQGALQYSHATIAFAITGIAGPTGGTDEKPVGTVCFALAKKNERTQMFTQHFPGERAAVRHRAVVYGLNIILQQSL